MRKILAVWLSLSLVLPVAVPAQDKPLAAVGRVSVLGEVTDTQRQIIANRLSAQLSQRYDIISQQEYERAEEEAFAALAAEQCTEEACIRKIQEYLQVERVFILQIVREAELTQLSLTLFKGDSRRVVEDACVDCTISQLYQRIDGLTDRLAQEDLSLMAQAPPPAAAPPPAEAAPPPEQDEGGIAWWVWLLGALAIGGIAALAAGGGGGEGEKDSGSVGFNY
jgi:hypothetical protein